ncbi:ParB/RepB/Spo0J family partition protein [Sphingomonas abietis]|uniref:ParB N-terminal domain-containing protein n=1 Tax=Sphingomonas abietis TaxID=3012344 RepID=A0ABY7NX21_9SPHN|nr:ParB N-terminal domain-containing protein [Sphingomonas abietis]WBO24464.1 ParB N-terminal domain-containing protein [Sphingomonas abietis]
MKLLNIELGKLSVSALNMRHGKQAPDVSDMLPSVRARGILVPLLVRPQAATLSGDEEATSDGYEIVAGRRRYHAALIVAQENGDEEPVPCAIMDAGDDAAALEASLIENIERLDPDEVSQWTTLTRLIQKEGRSVEQIAQTFGVTDLYIRRVLALGNLLPAIRELYRAEEIDSATIRHLTLASKARQREWLALHDDPKSHAPTRGQLRAWLFGGAAISTKVALFDLAGFKGRIKADLFGEGGVFDDPDQFWKAQNEAIAARRDAYLEAGWSHVEVMEPGSYFHSYEHERVSKDQGGKVFISVRHDGEVEIHEGYLSSKEARRARSAAAKGATSEADKATARAGRSEVTSALQTYIDLHRHAAVRAVLADHPPVALRLMVAHAITDSPLWSVKIERQAGRAEAITESVETCAAETAFDTKRRAVLAMLGLPDDAPTVVGANGSGISNGSRTVAIFVRLLALCDADVLRVIAIVMGETLAAGSAVVEAV